MRKVLGCLRKACNDYKMIENNDKICVGFSGGKDSMLLLYALKLYQNFSNEKFDIIALIIDTGFKNVNINESIKFVENLGIECELISTRISEKIIGKTKSKSPCSFCSKLRRGILDTIAKEKNCNKVALGHHLDDGISTLFLSMFYEGRMHTFEPKSYMTRKKITIIRPFIYLTEKHIINVIKKEKLPVFKNPCPLDGNTKREYMNKLVQKISVDIPFLRKNLLNSLQNKEQLRLWF